MTASVFPLKPTKTILDTVKKRLMKNFSMSSLNLLPLLSKSVRMIMASCFILNSSENLMILRHYSERVAPLKPTKTILDTVKKRLMNEEVTLYCTVLSHLLHIVHQVFL